MRRIALMLSIAAAMGVLALFFWLRVTTPLAEFFWTRFSAGTIALALDTKDAQLAFIIGTQAYGLRTYDLPLAERAFRRAITINPATPLAHYDLARILFVKGDFPDALAEINKELANYPQNFRSLYIRGLIYAYSHRLADAERDFTDFSRWAPTEWAGYNDLAWVLAQEGKYAEAESVLDRAFVQARGAQDNPWLWNNLGVQQLNEEKYTDAVGSFTKAGELAASLDESAWRAAYPGNDPAGSISGIRAFQTAIATNLTRARLLTR